MTTRIQKFPDTLALPSRTTQIARVAIQSIGVGLFYLCVVAYFGSRSDNFLTMSNFTGILAVAAPLGIVAFGQTVAIISGGFDLSVGGVVPLGAVVYGSLSNSMSPITAIAITLLVGAVAGLANGIVIQGLKINPFICTLATLSVTGGLAFVITGGLIKPMTSPQGGFWGDDAFGSVQWCVIAFIVLAVVIGLVLRSTTLGRSIYAIGGNREAAELAGVRVGAVTTGVYVVSGLFAAFAGTVIASQLLSAAPTVGGDIALNSVAATIIGGAALTGGSGTIAGTVLGVLLLGTVSNGLNLLQVSSYYQSLVIGAILLLAVGFARLREVLLLHNARSR